MCFAVSVKEFIENERLAGRFEYFDQNNVLRCLTEFRELVLVSVQLGDKFKTIAIFEYTTFGEFKAACEQKFNVRLFGCCMETGMI